MAKITKATPDDFAPCGLPVDYNYEADEAIWADETNTRVVTIEGVRKGLKPDEYPTAEEYHLIYPDQRPGYASGV